MSGRKSSGVKRGKQRVGTRKWRWFDSKEKARVESMKGERKEGRNEIEDK